MNTAAQELQQPLLGEKFPTVEKRVTISRQKFYLLLTVYLVVGSSASIMLKIQNTQFTEIDGVMV